MSKYDELVKSGIDLSPCGFEICDNLKDYAYYCTPMGAEIIGCAGVDGIHYCTIPQFGEMIFAVNPMDFGDCVHPIARNFDDLLRLLFTCADMSVLEQCYVWDEEQYKAFLLDCPPTDEQKNVLDAVREKFDLTPIDDVFSYVKKLQAGFDLSQIPYTDDYYDTDMNPAAPKNLLWNVRFGGGFFDNCDNDTVTEEISTDTVFRWGDEIWHVPAVYVFERGIVVDFCTEVDYSREKEFIDKYREFDGELSESIEAENPLCINFRPTAILNGYPLKRGCGYGISYIPAELLDVQNQREAEETVRHYGLDCKKAWVFSRYSFFLDGASSEMIEELSVKLEREKVPITAASFKNPSVGYKISVTHPTRGTKHTITVSGYRQTEMSFHSSDEYEYPTHCTEMTFTVSPDLSKGNIRVRDRLENDEPKRRVTKSRENGDDLYSGAIAIIGGADGPTTVLLSEKSGSNALHSAYSALHFEPRSDVEWRVTFYEKPLCDIEIKIL